MSRYKHGTEEGFPKFRRKMYQVIPNLQTEFNEKFREKDPFRVVELEIKEKLYKTFLKNKQTKIMMLHKCTNRFL